MKNSDSANPNQLTNAAATEQKLHQEERKKAESDVGEAVPEAVERLQRTPQAPSRGG